MGKRRMTAVVLAMLLALQLVPGRAYAAAGELLAHENFAIGAYTRNDINVAEGNLYVLTVTTADTLAEVTEETLLYIGAAQATAADEAAHSITFHGVRLRRLVKANYFVTGIDTDGDPLPDIPEASGTLEVIGRIAAEYPGVFRLTMIDEFGYYYAGDEVLTDADGAFAVGGLAPGRYKLRVDRPGYAPLFYAPSGMDYLTLTEDYTAFLADIDMSARLGDVNGDSVISVQDMMALTNVLAAGGYTASADLDSDGTVGGADLARLAIAGGPILSSLGGADAPVLAAESARGEDEGLYTLALTMTDVAESSVAAGVTLSYDSDVIALCDADGVSLDPADEQIDAAFTPAEGLWSEGVNWSETDGRGTVTLQVCATAVGASVWELGTLRFMLRPDKSEDDLYIDSIAVQTAWVVGETTMARFGPGEDTLVCVENYVNPSNRLAELTLTGPGSASLPVYYPSVNQPGTVNTRPTAVSFDLVGQSAQGKVISPGAVTWQLTADDPTGLELIGGILYVSSAAAAGTVTVRAVSGAVESNEVSLELTREASAPTVAMIFRNEERVTTAVCKVISGESQTFDFTAVVYDQYNAPVEDAELIWSAPEGLPVGVEMNDGVVTVGANAEEKSFLLKVESGPIFTAAALQVKLRRVTSLKISGASAIAIPPTLANPNSAEENTTAAGITLSVAALDADGEELAVPSDIVWSLTQSNSNVTIIAEEDAASADLSVKPKTQPGSVTVVAKSGNIQATRSVTIARAPSVGYRMVLTRSGKTVGASDAITGSASYAVQVFDQYDQTMSSPTVRWSGSPPAGVTLNTSTGAIVVGAAATGGTFTLRASCGEAVRMVSVTITVSAAPPPQGDTGPAGPAVTTPTESDVPYSPDGPVMATLTPEANETAPGRFETTLTTEAITAAAVRTGTLIVRPQLKGTADAVTLTLANGGVSALARHTENNLALETPLGTIKITSAALTAVAAGQDLRLTVRRDGELYIAEVGYGDDIWQSVAGGVLLILPAAVAPSDRTAVLVGADGSETVIRKSAMVNGMMRAVLDGSAAVKLVDRAVGFSDIAGHWAADAVTFAAAHELVRGVDDSGTFAPGMTMTRGMLVTVLHRIEDEPTARAQAVLSDVPDGSWYQAAMNWAGEVGIVNVSAGIAVPEQEITREQIATMLYRYAGVLALNTAARKPLAAFPDAEATSEYADDAMRWAVAVGLITGKSDGRLDPLGSATRAEVATMLERFVIFLVRAL